MKNYEEVAESVFKRSEEMIVLNKKRRRDRLINIGATVSCLAVAGAVGIGVWKTAARPDAQVVSGIYPQQSSAVQSAGQFANDGKDHSGENDTVNSIIMSSTKSSVTESSEVTSGSAAASSESSAENIVFPALESSANNSVNNPISGMAGGTLDNYNGPMNFLTVIEEYGTANTIPGSAPENGTYVFSDALKGAMDEYGYTDENGDIRYRVVANYYDNGEPVDVNSSAIRENEWNRLCGRGYECHFETCGKEWGNIVDHHFCMMLTREQLESFTPCEGYGCTLCLYGEKHCILLDDDTSTSSDYITPAQNQGCHHGWGAGNGYGNGYGHHGDHC